MRNWLLALAVMGAMALGIVPTSAYADGCDGISLSGGTQIDALCGIYNRLAPDAGQATADKQDETNDRLGEVQASPTANTVLDRLKTLHSDLTNTDPVAVKGTGTAGSPATDVLTVQGIGGGTSIPTTSQSGSTTAATQTTASNLNAQVVGAQAGGATYSGNPIVIGCVNTQPSLSAGQLGAIPCNTRGSQFVAITDSSGNAVRATNLGGGGYALNTWDGLNAPWQTTVTLSDGTNTTLHAACGSSTKNYVVTLDYSTVAATTAVELDLNDNTTAIWKRNIPAGANSSNINFGLPTAKVGSNNTAINVQLSGAPTGAVIVNASGYCAP